jgi:hypothetical protein
VADLRLGGQDLPFRGENLLQPDHEILRRLTALVLPRPRPWQLFLPMARSIHGRYMPKLALWGFADSHCQPTTTSLIWICGEMSV